MTSHGRSETRHRRSLRLPEYEYSQVGAYFITVCATSRECLFGEVVDGEMLLNEAGRIVQAIWHRLSNRFANVELDALVVMPNHVHAVITIVDGTDVGAGLALPGGEAAGGTANLRPTTLGDIVGAFKSLSAINVNRLLVRSGPVRQRNYYEHIIRDETSLNRIRDYIAINPSQWHLDTENPERRKSIGET